VIRDFAKVVDALGSEPGVSRSKMFGSEGLKVGKSVFAPRAKVDWLKLAREAFEFVGVWRE